MSRTAGFVAVAAAVVALLVLGGCYQTTWRSPPPSAPLSEGTALVVGSIQFVPEILQYDPNGHPTMIIAGEMAGNWVAAFDRDGKSERNRGAWPPYIGADLATIPTAGTFFVEVHTGRPVYLRGVAGMTNQGPFRVDVGLKLDVRKGDQVVYVGHLIVNRIGEGKILVKDRESEARGAAKSTGRTAALTARWAKRLVIPPGQKGPMIAEAGWIAARP